MNRHFSSLELVDAVEGQFASTHREHHLDACGDCRSRFSELRAVMAHVGRAGEVPEPSPLFWDHFSQRVRAATGDIVPARAAFWSSGWSSGWRPIAGAAAVFVALFLAVAVRPQLPVAMRHRTVAGDMPLPAAPSPAGEDETLNVVTSSMSFEDLQLAVQPTSDATDAMVAQLSTAERQELVRLIRAEKGSSE